METFCLPWHEIQDRFTSSELVLMGWRSAEQGYNWRKKMKKAEHNEGEEEYSITTSHTNKYRKEYADARGPEVMPDEFFAQKTIRDERGRLIAEAGDFNLSQVTGEKARRYFESILRIPMPAGVSKISNEPGSVEDETTAQIRKAYGIRR